MAFLIPHLVDEAAEQRSDHQAAVFLEQSLSWEELSHASDQLACHLQRLGIRRGDRVGVLMGKCLEIPIAIYGIMKAGAAYVPLDPAAPLDRHQAILDDCDIKHLVSEPRQVSRLKELPGWDSVSGVEAAALKNCRSWSEIRSQQERFQAPRIVESDLAYIIYTSGSTGTPKGIMHSHRSGVVYAEWATKHYRFHCDDRFTNHAPLHFDMSTFDWFVPAAAKACTVVIPEPYMMMPASYTQLLESEKVTAIFIVPFALVQFLQRGALEQRDLGSLRWIIFGGESVASKFIGQLMQAWPTTQFSHMYGPAETNGCTVFEVTDIPDNGPISIGVPFEHMDGLVLNDSDEPIRVGTGELVMRGSTTMLGYWNRPELTQNAFFRRQLPNQTQEAYYRTGDLVRREENGLLYFIGRKDHQTKIRGFRVELGEVEEVLSSHPGIEEAAAYTIRDADETTRLYAAVRAKSDSSTSLKEVLSHARAKLPPYAVPNHLELVAELPRTSTGKIDRVRLQQAAQDKN